jgi:hypothetical protein
MVAAIIMGLATLPTTPTVKRMNPPARSRPQNPYRLIADGRTFALVYSRVHDQVLYPLTAHDQPIAAPAPVRAAWRTITRHIDSTVAATRLGRAA